jgi:hypothetical protein
VNRNISLKLILGVVLFFGFSAAMFIHADVEADGLPGQATCGTLAIQLNPATATYGDEIEILVNISGNQCEISSFGFDLLFDSGMFTYLGLEGQNTLTSDWSMLDGNEINAGQVRIGGYSGTGTNVPTGQNGTLIKIRLEVSGQCGTYPDGQQSTITIESYFDDLTSYLPQSLQGTFTLTCCSGDISLPTDIEGAWGDLVFIPVNVAGNSNAICGFQFDFVFDPNVLEFKDTGRSNAIQDWSTLSWNQVSPGTIRVTGSAGSGTCIAAASSASMVVLKVMVNCVGYGSDTNIPVELENYQSGIAGLCPRTLEEDLLYRACPRLGDTNSDGNVTPGDAQTAFEIFLGKIAPTDLQLTTADANSGCPCDGLLHIAANNCITPGDAQWIFEHFLHKRTLPICSAEYTCPETAPMSFRLPDFQAEARQVVYALPSMGEPGELVKIPILVNDPDGLRVFRLDMIYPQELLEYRGILASPLTSDFEYVRGEEDVPGVVRIEGNGEMGIRSTVAGSLCVAVFQVKDGMTGSAPLELCNLNDDLFEAEALSGMFKSVPPFENEGSVAVGKAGERGGKLFVPVRVTGAMGLKAFGLEFSVPGEKLSFIGLERTDMIEDFVFVDGFQDVDGTLKVGGFAASPNQDHSDGVLIRMVFEIKESGAEVEIVNVFDDLADFIVIR